MALIWSKMTTGLPFTISSAMRRQDYVSRYELDIDIHKYVWGKTLSFPSVTHVQQGQVGGGGGGCRQWACHDPEFGNTMGPVLKNINFPGHLSAEGRTGLAGKLTSRAFQRYPAGSQRRDGALLASGAGGGGGRGGLFDQGN
jgi:hypothetical protein